MSYDAYQTLLMREQNQLLHEQANLMRVAAGQAPLAPSRLSGARRLPPDPVRSAERGGYVILAVMAALLVAAVVLVGWGAVELLALLIG